MTLCVRVRAFTIVAGAALLLQPSFGQQGGQAPPQSTPPSGGGTAPGGNTGTTRPPTSNFPNPNQTQQPGMERNQQWPETNRPIFLSGKVVTDDGTPPPETAVIERVCGGVVRPEAYTDSKGHFSFELGRNQSMFADASVGSMGGMGPGGMGSGGMGGMNDRSNPMGGRGFSERDLMGCEIRATLPGYRSEVVSLATRRAFDNPDIGTILLHRLGKVEGRIISGTSLNAPKDAKKAYDKGQDFAKKKKYEDALKNFQKAVEIYPKYAAAWNDMGRLQEQQQQFEEAKKSYAASAAADPRYINPYLQLSGIALRERNWQDLADQTDRIVKLDPFDYPQAYFYNSVANYNLKKYDLAEKSALETQKLDTKHQFPKANHLLGILLAEKRDYTGAAEQMRSYLKFAPSAQDAGTVRDQLAQIEKLAGGERPADSPAPPR